jgi:hypothetical protein
MHKCVYSLSILVLLSLLFPRKQAVADDKTGKDHLDTELLNPPRDYSPIMVDR